MVWCIGVMDMENNKEIVKRRLKVFLPGIAAMTILAGLAIYYLTASNNPMPSFGSLPPIPPNPIASENSFTHVPTKAEVTMRADPTEVLKGLDPETVQLVEEMERGEINQLEASLKLIRQMNDSTVKVVPHRQLSDIFPDHLAGFTAGKASSSGTSMLGIKAAKAQRKYTGSDGQFLLIKIIDSASMQKMSAMLDHLADSADLHNETDEKIEKTVNIGDIRGFASYSKVSDEVNIHAVMAKRFIIEATGTKMDIKTLQSHLNGIDFSVLRSLAAQANTKKNNG